MKRSNKGKIENVRIKFRKELWRGFKQMCMDAGKDIHEEVNRLIENELTLMGIQIPEKLERAKRGR